MNGDVASRCGSVHDLEEFVTMFIEELEPTIGTTVRRYSESNRKPNYPGSVQLARYGGYAVRAHGVHHARSGARPVRVLKPSVRRTVNLTQSSSELTESPVFEA